jgi:tetratricopeptide (TPR) repeat protein
MLARANSEDDVDAGVLSLHFLNAQRFTDAWRYARLGAERAQERYALVDAADLYRRALAAGRQGKVGVVELADVWEALGDVAERIGAYEEAAAAFRGARRHLRGSHTVEARLLLKSASVVEDTGSQAVSLRLLGRGMKLLEGIAGYAASAERARLAARYALGRYRQGRHREAMRWCERAIDEAVSSGDKEALAAAYLVLDMVTVELDSVDDIPYGRLALQIYEELGDLPKQASILNNLGAAAYYEGRWHEALELYERAAELFERTGDVISHADEMYNIGELLCEQGRLAEAEERLTEASRIWRAAGRTLTLPYATRELARVAYRSGRHHEALAMLAEAREAFAAGEAQAEVLETDVRIAECLLYGGELERALDLIGDLLDAARRRGEIAGVRTPRLQRILGYALLAAGHVSDAKDALELSVASARETGAEYELGLALAGLAHLAALEGTDAGAFEVESREVLDALGVVELPPLPAAV